MSTVYNVRFWCCFCWIPQETYLTNTRKKNFPSSPTLLHCLFYHYSWGGLSAELYTQKFTSMAWNEMMKLATLFKLIHTSHLWHDWFSFRMLKYGIVSLLFFSVVTANVYSLGLSGNGKKLTCRRTTEMNTDEIWKCNFPSANHFLKAQVNHQSGKSFVRSYSFRIFYLIGQLASLIKLFDSDTTLYQVLCFSRYSRNIVLHFHNVFFIIYILN